MWGGVTADDLVLYKGKRSLIPFEDLMEIVRNIRFVDVAVPQYDMDKLTMCKKLGPPYYLWVMTGTARRSGSRMRNSSTRVNACMKTKGAPVYSIEPQIYYATQQAKKDGITMMIIGDGADYVFGGMDGLLGKDWGYHEYVERSIYVKPEDILVIPVIMDYLFERYRVGQNSIISEVFMMDRSQMKAMHHTKKHSGQQVWRISTRMIN